MDGGGAVSGGDSFQQMDFCELFQRRLADAICSSDVAPSEGRFYIMMFHNVLLKINK